MSFTLAVDMRGDEDQTGELQVMVWRDLFDRRRRELGSQVVEFAGRVSNLAQLLGLLLDLCNTGP